MDFFKELLTALQSAKVTLSPVLAAVPPIVIAFMKYVKDPDKMKWWTAVSAKARAWNVMLISTVLVLAVEILLLADRDWVRIIASSLLVGVMTVGLYEWVKALRTKDPRRP